MAVIQFTKDTMQWGFKLTRDFLISPVGKESIKEVKNFFGNKKLFVIPQHDKSSKYRVALLNQNYEKKLNLDYVVDNIVYGKSFVVPMVDGIWMTNPNKDKVILTYSQTAPIIVAECSSKAGDNYVFISTMLRKDITKDNFKKILNALPMEHSIINFEVISATAFDYEEGTIVEQVQSIVEELGCTFTTPRTLSNVNTNTRLFGYGDIIKDFPELGLANNLVALI